MRKYKVYGLRRSGNHFFIEWVLSHFKFGHHANAIGTDGETESHWLMQNGVIKKGFYNDNVDVTISSWEDTSPKKIDNDTIILLRDWYNICSSRIKSNRGWEDTCKGSKCESVYLSLCKLYDTNPSNFVLYNKLVADVNYVKEIENRYGWGNVPIQKKFPQSKIGNGSSFNGKEPKNVNQRYKIIMKNNPKEWSKVVNNKEINIYMEKIFNIKL